MSSQRGRGGGQKFSIILSKKTTKRGGGGQKFSVLRRHSLRTAPKSTCFDVYLANAKGARIVKFLASLNLMEIIFMLFGSCIKTG